MKDFTQLIDRVIGKKGILRAPSWWVRRIFLQIQEAIDSLMGTQKEVQNTLTDLTSKSSPYVIAYFNNPTQVEVDSKLISVVGYAEIYYKSYFKLLATPVWLDLHHGKITSEMVEMYKDTGIPLSSSKIYGLSEFLNTASTPIKPQLSVGLVEYTQPLSLRPLTDLSNLVRFGQDSIIDLQDLGSVTDISGAFKGATIISLPKLPKVEKAVSAFSSSLLLQVWANNSELESLRDASYMFSDCYKLTLIKGVLFHRSPLENTSYMFKGCSSLSTLDGWGMNMANVTNMEGMFYDCKALPVDIKALYNTTTQQYYYFSTSNVINMRKVFTGYQGTTLDLYASDDIAEGSVVFDTTNVTSMKNMFQNCSNLRNLRLGKKFFATKAVTEVDFTGAPYWDDQVSVKLSLVTNLYDRKTAGLPELTLKLATKTRDCLSSEDKTYITEHGYKIA